MTTPLGRYRYWGEQEPDRSRPLLTFSRAADAVAATPGTADQPVATGTLRIYGPIDSYGGWWGVSANEVARALDLLGDAERIVVRVNSPGGESSEGRAIMNLLRAHRATCIGVVDGAAYSAASYIAVGCDETVMSPGTTLMIHDTSTFWYGNAQSFRKIADRLDVLSNSGAELYAEVAGGTVEQWRAAQQAETWYSAASAVAAGLADRVGVVPDAGPAETAGDDGPEPAPDDTFERANASYDLSLYDGTPPQHPAASAPGESHTPTQKEGSALVSDFTDTELAAMRQGLGLPNDADASTIVAALSEALAEQAADPATPPAETGTGTAPEGMVLIPQAALEDLQRNGAAGAAAAEQLRVQSRDAYLESVRDRFPPASREAWATQYDRDPEGTRSYLDAAPVLVPTTELGHSADGEKPVDVTETDVYKNWSM